LAVNVFLTDWLLVRFESTPSYGEFSSILYAIDRYGKRARVVPSGVAFNRLAAAPIAVRTVLRHVA